MDLKLTIMDYMEHLENIVIDCENGIITDDEYVVKKNDILNELFEVIIEYVNNNTIVFSNCQLIP
jgi:hypothetical protein